MGKYMWRKFEGGKVGEKMEKEKYQNNGRSKKGSEMIRVKKTEHWEDRRKIILLMGIRGRKRNF